MDSGKNSDRLVNYGKFHPQSKHYSKKNTDTRIEISYLYWFE
jgi:hypothetical protein